MKRKSTPVSFKESRGRWNPVNEREGRQPLSNTLRNLGGKTARIKGHVSSRYRGWAYKCP